MMSELNSLIQEIKSCGQCALSQSRTNTVPGEGSITAEIMFVGEGPGFYEDRDGVPFVGPAGQFLEELLGSIGLTRENVFITNMVKCRPPNNRDPLPPEIQSCKPYLDRQVAMISPKVIATLGRFSLSKFFPGETISKARGTPRNWNGHTIYPLYHPAAALHNPKLRQIIIDDFSRLPNLVNDSNRTPNKEKLNQTHQLTLFDE